MNIIWFKRDLRTADHEPLLRSIEQGPSIGLFIIEPEWFQSDEFSSDHLRFVLQGLHELKDALAMLGVPLLIRQGSAVDVFGKLHCQSKIQKIFSHEESGLRWTYNRDLLVGDWCRHHSVVWQEFRQFGVIRGLKNRDEWAKKRSLIVERPLHVCKGQERPKSPWHESVNLPWDLLKGHSLKPFAQTGGLAAGRQLLNSFLEKRAKNYFYELSSPISAFDSCSRLSPYLAWGHLSISEVLFDLEKRKRKLHLEPPQDQRAWRLSMKSFESRLSWHCHFVQKLESEPEIEFQNFNPEFRGLRESEWNEAKFQAWCRGETGFPMIDACMKALLQYGWINFRMRAMLISFASYQLWLHWKKPAIFLAQQFLDFEPGIHYSQVQMQSGVTGINTIRIYSPKKQQIDQDPNGDFVRRFLPELRDVETADLTEPHKMPPLLKMSLIAKGTFNYPEPIVDSETSYRIAREKIFAWKKRASTQAASVKVYAKHGSRQNKNFPRQKRLT